MPSKRRNGSTTAAQHKSSPAHAGGAFILPFCNTAQYKRLQRVLYRLCNYTVNTAKQRTGLYRGVSCHLAYSTAQDTRPTQAAIIPPVPRWTLDRSTHPPYYNRVYKGAAVCSLLWIYTRRCNTLQTMPARRRFRRFPRLVLAWHASGIMLSSWHGSAEPLTATAVSLFGLSLDSQ